MNEKIWKITQGGIFQIFSIIFWAMRRLRIFILKFPDLYSETQSFCLKIAKKIVYVILWQI